LEVYTCQSFPDHHRRTQRNLADLYFRESRWHEAIAAFRGALAASDLLYRAAATPEARHAELREVRDLPARLAYALSQIATASGNGTLLREAVLALEQNRARWLSAVFALHSEQPACIPDEIWHTFVTHRERIGQLQAEARLPEHTPGKRDFLILTKELCAAYTDLDDSVDNIRCHVSDFMSTPTFDQIKTAVRLGKPLIYLAVSPSGSIALIVTPTTIHPLHTSLTDDDLREHIYGPPGDMGWDSYLGAYALWRSSPSPNAWRAVLDDTTNWLWDSLMAPLVQTLADLDIHHATLIPQGWLGLLPLHAAWTETGGDRHYARDEVCFTYAPNARALSAARQTADRVSADRIFAVYEPQPVSANPLPNSNQEVFAACDHFQQDRCKILTGEAATEAAVRDQLPNHAVLHFSCHGLAGFNKPLDGGLLMSHDNMLTLRKILSLRIENVRLAVLSACETGVPGIDLPDEVIGLPTGLLQAGVAGVVGSLWAVNDFSTALLMMRFYEAWREEGQAPPDALHTAQTWLRESTNTEFQAYFQAQLPELTGERMPHEVASAAYRRFTLSPDKDARPFAHPFHWAGFYYTGV
jgi:CHAT domain-containing protein